MKFVSSHSHRQFLEIQFMWKLASVINYVFVFFGRHLSVNILMADANKIRSPNVDRTNHRVAMMVTRQAVTLARSRNQGSTAVGLYMSLSAILNM